MRELSSETCGMPALLVATKTIIPPGSSSNPLFKALVAVPSRLLTVDFETKEIASEVHHNLFWRPIHYTFAPC